MEQTCVLRSSNIYSTIVYINFSERLFNKWYVTFPRVTIDLTCSYLIQSGESKTSPSLPPLMYLVTIPLSTVPSASPQYARYLATIFSEILTVPLLLNRLPLDHLPKFISRLSLSSLNVLDPHITSIVQSSNLESRIHLASIIFLFLSPQYKALPPAALSTYLRLSIVLFNEFPTNFRSASSRATKTTKRINSYQSDSDDVPSTRVKVVAKFSTAPPLPQVDDKTMKRFQNIIAAPHLTSIISATRSNSALFPLLVQYLFTLMTTWPSSREQILNIVLATTGGGLVREVYRELVRQSPLGKEEKSERLLGKLGSYLYLAHPIMSLSCPDPTYAPHWPPILFLCDIYSQALMTMGDDEFFGSTAARNPLTLDELVSFGRQLLNIAFTLYWRDDQTLLQETNVSSQVKCTWEDVRDKATKCLLDIHAREYVPFLFLSAS